LSDTILATQQVFNLDAGLQKCLDAARVEVAAGGLGDFPEGLRNPWDK
jgi:hypothetical protein